MKLKKLYIENHKMFHDFNINFVDKNDKPLPIVVLAGVNGSGKTTLLEYIYNDYTSHINHFSKTKNYIEVVYSNEIHLLNMDTFNKKKPLGLAASGLYEEEFNIDNFSKNIIYLKAGIDDISLVEKEFQKSWYNFLKNHDYRPSEVGVKFNNYIKDIFDIFDLTFEYSRLDKDDNVLFKNKDDEEFKIEELSTGEKTLLSKILFLFFKDYKNKVILIDEPELSLHPHWQNKVLHAYEKFANKNNCQIIMATHSPHIISSVKNEYLKVLRKNNDGKIEALSNLKTHGRDINSVLFDVMGEVPYRPKEFRNKIDKLYYLIEEEKNYELSKSLLEELIDDYGKNDSVVIEASILIDMMDKEV